MAFKFEKLEIWQLSVELTDMVYALTDTLPNTERFNLRTQTQRAATSVSLNIAEGSTGQTNAQQVKFLSYANRSVIEVVACVRLMLRREYISDDQYKEIYQFCDHLSMKIQAMRKHLDPGKSWIREDEVGYRTTDDGLS
jgi:four helix bundle protein